MADAGRHLSALVASASEGGRPAFAAVARWVGWRPWMIGLLAGLFALAPGLRAQPANVAAVRFTVFAAKPVSDVAFVPRAGVPPQKVAFYPTARSPKYEYRGAMPLRFVDAMTGVVVAEASIPAGMRDALLLFTPLEKAAAGKSGSLRYQVAVLDDSVARQPSGTVAIINLSGLSLSGTVNKENVTLRPGLNPAITVGKSATIRLRTTYKQRDYQAYGATVTLAARQRALVILFPPFNAGSLEVQSRVLLDEPGAPPAR